MTTPAPRETGPLGLDIDHFRVRIVQDALTEATAAYWLRRAQALEHARPRPGDHTGTATTTQLTAADARCALAARLCRHRATLALPQPHDSDEEVT